MTGIFKSSQHLFHVGPAPRNTRPDEQKRLGRARDPYYGLQAQQTLDGKHGTKRYADSVIGKNNSVLGKSASSKMLGGGG